MYLWRRSRKGRHCPRGSVSVPRQERRGLFFQVHGLAQPFHNIHYHSNLRGGTILGAFFSERTFQVRVTSFDVKSGYQDQLLVACSPFFATYNPFSIFSISKCFRLIAYPTPQAVQPVGSTSHRPHADICGNKH